MQLYRLKIRMLFVVFEHLSRASDAVDPRHQDMTFVEFFAKSLDSLVCNPSVGSSEVKLYDSFKADRFKIAFQLSLSKRVLEDQLPIEWLAIFSKRRRGKLHDLIAAKPLFESAP